MKHIGSSELQEQLLRLGTLLQLARRARQAASRPELGFIIVNETHQLVPYRLAVLARAGGGRRRVAAISGSPGVEHTAPFTQWLGRLFKDVERSAAAGAPKTLEAGDLQKSIGKDWDEWLPRHGLLVPLRAERGALGTLLLTRDRPWTQGEQVMLAELADGYAHAWASLENKSSGRVRRYLAGLVRPLQLIVLLALVGLLFLPVRLSALAPAEIVPLRPTIVRAPLDGVVDHMEVLPNAVVAKGDLLLSLDPRALSNQLDVAQKTLAIAQAEYRQAAQQAVFDDRSRAQLAVLKVKADQRQAELDYVQSLLDRIKVTATRDGIAVYGDPDDWAGRPVALGERIMEIADPASSEIEVWLPVADAITLDPGSEVEMFLNVSPDAPIKARLRQASYEAEQSAEGVLGYRLRAELADPADKPRIGLRGTAKLYGAQVSLAYYLLRRPLAAGRQLLGI